MILTVPCWVTINTGSSSGGREKIYSNTSMKLPPQHFSSSGSIPKFKARA